MNPLNTGRKMNFRTFGLIALMLVGCSRIPPVDPPSGERQLIRSINRKIAESGLETNIGIQVVALKTGKTIYALNQNHLFNPASNNKLFTASATVHYLPPDYRFSTTVWTDSSAIVTRTADRLVLKGGGDPDLFYEDLDTLAQAVANLIDSVGILIIDNTVMDTVRQGSGWMWDEGSAWYAAQIDGLSFNDNCIDFHVSPGESGNPPLITIHPNTRYVKLINTAVTVRDTVDLKDFSIRRQWWNSTNTFDITGDFYVTKPDTLVYYRNVQDPALFTGTVFSEMLEKYGVKFGQPLAKGVVRTNEVLIAERKSEPLISSMTNFLKKSDNLTGELYLKTIAHLLTGKPGSWNQGTVAVRSFLQQEVGVDTTSFAYADGSGISRYNYCSPAILTKLLTYIYSHQNFRDVFMEALPIGGRDGTLERRMKGEIFTNRVHAKTGTLSGVTSLSGFIFPRHGDPLAFSIMMNGYVDDSKPFRDLQDGIAEILINYKN